MFGLFGQGVALDDNMYNRYGVIPYRRKDNDRT